MRKPLNLLVLAVLFLIFDACKDNQVPEGALSDEDMFNLIQNQNFTY